MENDKQSLFESLIEKSTAIWWPTAIIAAVLLLFHMISTMQ